MSGKRNTNLLILMSDEHQARAMGSAGHPFVQTPYLDALAARGMRFSNAYTPCPICVPARAAFATGQYVHRIRLWDNAMPYVGQPRGWGHALQANGVPVESVGKLHYRDAEDPTGFDRQTIPMNVAGGVGMVWAATRALEERVRPASRMLGAYIGPGESPYTTYDADVTACAVDWLKARSGDERPWCLFVGLVAPHFPLVCPQEFYDFYPLDSLPEVKLGPGSGYEPHPWVRLHDDLLDTENAFTDAKERLRAMAAYYGLCSWLDSNVGRILAALDEAGLSGGTTVVYTSDHGEDLGARGSWGKGNFYEEAAAVPLILAGPDVPQGVCGTPVSLLDLSETILDHFGAELEADRPGRSLYAIAAEPYDGERAVFSEYHAIGAVEGGFMLRKGGLKLIHYEGFEPELFDLAADPEELEDVSRDPAYAGRLADLYAELARVCSTAEVNRQAHADQAALVASFGGKEAVAALGAPGATPPPSRGEAGSPA
ncbi:MAG: sulfatase-like hydrolase/transferase [Chloroflexi bacterium]|nr:sulfatase-like hydrolase/transferase [Chloroflexota bacterium]